jgi:hypothetical protein
MDIDSVRTTTKQVTVLYTFFISIYKICATIGGNDEKPAWWQSNIHTLNGDITLCIDSNAHHLFYIYIYITVVKVLRYKTEGRWFDPGWCQFFH